MKCQRALVLEEGDGAVLLERCSRISRQLQGMTTSAHHWLLQVRGGGGEGREELVCPRIGGLGIPWHSTPRSSLKPGKMVELHSRRSAFQPRSTFCCLRDLWTWLASLLSTPDPACHRPPFCALCCNTQRSTSLSPCPFRKRKVLLGDLITPKYNMGSTFFQCSPK